MEVLLQGWGKDERGTGWTDRYGKVNSITSKQPRHRETCSQSTQSLSSTWDLAFLEQKLEALNWGKKSNFHSGMFSG